MGLQVAEEVQDYGPDVARDVTPTHERPRRGGTAFTPVQQVSDAQAPNDEILDGEIETEALDGPGATPEEQARMEDVARDIEEQNQRESEGVS